MPSPHTRCTKESPEHAVMLYVVRLRCTSYKANKIMSRGIAFIEQQRNQEVRGASRARTQKEVESGWEGKNGGVAG